VPFLIPAKLAGNGAVDAANLAQSHLSGFQVSVPPPANTTAGLIEKETK
jgi:hypothetical protein